MVSICIIGFVVSGLSEIQNDFPGLRALFSQGCLFMQCYIFSKFTGPNNILQDMSFGPADFGKSGSFSQQELYFVIMTDWRSSIAEEVILFFITFHKVKVCKNISA